MPKFVALSCLALCLSAMPLFAQAPVLKSPTTSETYPQRTIRVSPDNSSYSRQLIQQRAMEGARQRMARLETRAWLGQSTARPTFGPGNHSGDMFGPLDRGGTTRFLVVAPNWYAPAFTESTVP